MAGGLGLAFLFENIDTTLYTSDEIEAITKLPSIGKVPKQHRRNLFNNINGTFAYEESYRHLRANILSMELPIRTLLITSAEPRDGKSTIIADLAPIMAKSGQNVVVVDGDLRIPSQHELFNVENKIGLSSVLQQKLAFTESTSIK